MTHLVWAPKPWLAKAERTLAGMAERHPSRTVILARAAAQGRPRRDRRRRLLRSRGVGAGGLVGGRRAAAEGRPGEGARVDRAAAPDPGPARLLPLARRAALGDGELDQLVGVVDRLVVDSTEWKGIPAAFDRLVDLFGSVAVSDIAWTRTREWRIRLAELWPDIRLAGSLEVTGPRAEALLLAGWLRSRLRKHVDLVQRNGTTLRRVAVDGERIEPPGADG